MVRLIGRAQREQHERMGTLPDLHRVVLVHDRDTRGSGIHVMYQNPASHIGLPPFTGAYCSVLRAPFFTRVPAPRAGDAPARSGPPPADCAATRRAGGCLG